MLELGQRGISALIQRLQDVSDFRDHLPDGKSGTIFPIRAIEGNGGGYEKGASLYVPD
jgi:hypothetical protein